MMYFSASLLLCFLIFIQVLCEKIGWSALCLLYQLLHTHEVWERIKPVSTRDCMSCAHLMAEVRWPVKKKTFVSFFRLTHSLNEMNSYMQLFRSNLIETWHFRPNQTSFEEKIIFIQDLSRLIVVLSPWKPRTQKARGNMVCSEHFLQSSSHRLEKFSCNRNTLYLHHHVIMRKQINACKICVCLFFLCLSLSPSGSSFFPLSWCNYKQFQHIYVQFISAIFSKMFTNSACVFFSRLFPIFP